MWSSKSFGSALKYGFFKTLIRTRLTTLARVLMEPIPLYYALKPESGKRSLCYLKRRFPSASRLKLFWHTYKLYNNFANNILDRMIIGCGGKVKVEHNEDALNIISRALEQGGGCVLVSAHFGSWQNGLMALKSLGVPLSVVFWQEEKVEHPFFQYENDVKIINACGGVESVLRMRNVLKKNQLLCFMGDRMTPRDTKFSREKFMGGAIKLPLYPYLFAKAMGAPVIFTASVRKNGAITGLPAVQAGDYAQMSAKFASFMENLVASHPHDFFNFYDLWEEDEQK